MNWHRSAFGVVGILSILFGIALLFVPAVGSLGAVQSLLERIETVGPTRTLLFTGAGLIGYLLIGLRSPAADREGTTDQFDRDPGDSDSVEGLAGHHLQRQVQTAIEDGSEDFVTVRERLQETAAAVYADLVGCTEQQARTAVSDGTWCNDPLVAAFLAGEDGPATPLGAQVRLFVFPRRERRRRIERTVAVIEEVERR
ncbi:hypothetical protein GRX03_13015 [Halovenus sp. WSH3]|uniref:Uncharacterized protein n=1 Tax=Halovenus carboxidivorans TaxID=2692199 RepID=A0A6B0T364_9EURY|nr:hypothetical protein [Halovenus carboxidivorans]MXR52524.1 hypothetical protein [Halovenus carboxidivorans]